MPKFGKEILKGTGLRDRISGMCAAISRGHKKSSRG